LTNSHSDKAESVSGSSSARGVKGRRVSNSDRKNSLTNNRRDKGESVSGSSSARGVKGRRLSNSDRKNSLTSSHSDKGESVSESSDSVVRQGGGPKHATVSVSSGTAADLSSISSDDLEINHIDEGTAVAGKFSGGSAPRPRAKDDSDNIVASEASEEEERDSLLEIPSPSVVSYTPGTGTEAMNQGKESTFPSPSIVSSVTTTAKTEVVDHEKESEFPSPSVISSVPTGNKTRNDSEVVNNGENVPEGNMFCVSSSSPSSSIPVPEIIAQEEHGSSRDPQRIGNDSSVSEDWTV
jgi:hypothetical protein